MFKVESYLSPFLLNWLNSYVKLKNEDFKLSLWEGDVVFNKLDLRLDVIQDLLRLPFNIRSGRIQELRIHVPWTKLGSEPIKLTINTIEFVLSLPGDDDKSYSGAQTDSALSTDFEKNAEIVETQSNASTQQQSRNASVFQAMVFKILNNIEIVVNNLIVKYIEGDMIVSVNVKSAETWSADENWNKAFVDVLPPKYALRKVANLHDATICLDRCRTDGKVESYNEPFMYRCSLQCKMMFEYPNPFARVPSATKLALFFGEPEFSLADTQLPLLLKVVRTCLTVIYGNGAGEHESRIPSTSTIVANTENMIGDQGPGWGNWAMSYLPGVVSWTTGIQAPIVLPPSEKQDGDETHQSNAPTSSFTFAGIYCKRVIFSLKLSKKHVDPLGTSSRIQFHPCFTVVATDVRTELVWRGETFFSCTAVLNSLVGRTAGFCTCHVRDEGEQVLSCGSSSPSTLPIRFDRVLDSIEQIPNSVDEHMTNYSEEKIKEIQPAFLLDIITDRDKSREKADAPCDELRRFQRAIFRWFIFNPTVTLTGGLFHRIVKFVGHAQKSDLDIFSTVRSEDSPRKNASALFDSEVTSLDFNVCGRSDQIQIRNFTLFVALNNHPSALPGLFPFTIIDLAYVCY